MHVCMYTIFFFRTYCIYVQIRAYVCIQINCICIVYVFKKNGITEPGPDGYAEIYSGIIREDIIH